MITLSEVKANLTKVCVNNTTYWFSYETCIAFRTDKLYICENIWSATTGKHLHYINPDKSIRIPYKEFQKLLEAL